MVSSSGTDSIVAEVGKACPHPAPAPIRQTQAARNIPRTTMAHLARFQTRQNLSYDPLITVIPPLPTVNKVITAGLELTTGRTHPFSPIRTPTTCRRTDCPTAGLGDLSTERPRGRGSPAKASS